MTEVQETHHRVRRESGSKSSFAKTMLLITSGMSGAMLGLALPNLISGSDIMIAVKTALLAAGGTAVSYAINRFAVERGAPLAVKGYGWAGLVSVLSIGIVGLGLFSATYAGLTFRDVEQLRIEAHGEALGSFVSERSAASAHSAGIVSAINALVADLTQKRDCEILGSCISGHTGGGNGPVARALHEKLGTAMALAQQVENSEATRFRTLEQLARLYGEYDARASGDLTVDEKRRALRELDLRIRQAVVDLDSAMPVALLATYSENLQGNVEIEGRPEAARRIAAILRPHGQAIAGFVGMIPGAVDNAPVFPKPTGVSDTFAYLGHFLPVAMIAGVVELVLPISLWLYTLFALSWSIERVAPIIPRPPHPDDEFYRTLLPAPQSARAIGRARPEQNERRFPRSDRSTRRKNGHRDTPVGGH